MVLRHLQIGGFVVWQVALCCIALAFSPVPTATAQTLSPEARKHFAAGRQAQEAGAFDQAAEEYSATVRLAPTFAGAYSNLGLIRYVQGNFKDSFVALQKAVQLDPKLVGANLYLGIDELKLNHPEKALLHLQHAAQLDRGNKDAQNWLGTAYWQSGQTWSALVQFREADREFPNDPDILFVLGEAYRKTADQEMQALIRRASGTAFVHQVFGDIYLDQHLLAKAAGHYQAALQQDPSTPGIHYELGEVALLGDHLDEAETEYGKQLQRTPADAASKARLAEVDLLRGQVTSALQTLGQALGLSPLKTVAALHMPPSFATTSEVMSAAMLERLRLVLPAVEEAPEGAARDLALATIAARLDQSEPLGAAWTRFETAIPHQAAASDPLARANQDFDRQSFETAEEEVHAWLGSHPQSLEAQYLQARVHRLLSLGVLDRLLANFPESYRSHQLLAQTYAQRDEDEKAIVEYKKVEELAPTLPGVHYAYGHLLMKDGDLEQATVQLQEELSLNPEQPEANAEMGMTLLSQGQAPAAVRYLTKAIALQPDLWTAHQELGKAFYLQKNYEGARTELTLALADDPEGIAHYQLGLVYKAIGQQDAAAREFASSKKIKSDRLSQVKIEMPAGSRNE